MAKKQPKRKKKKYHIGETKRKFGGKTYTMQSRSINKKLANENKKELKKQGYKSCRIVKIPKTKQSETMKGSNQNFKYSVFCRK